VLFISETSLPGSHHMYMIEERNNVVFFFFFNEFSGRRKRGKRIREAYVS